MSVNKKSFTEVEWMLTIAIIIILVIGLAGVIFLFFPWLEWGFSCIQLQRSRIDEVNTAIGEVILNGEEQIVRFRVEECTKCIWYNDEDAEENIHILEIEYEAADDSFSTPMAWDGVDTDSGCTNQGGVLVGPKTCTVDITVNPPQAQVTC